MIDAATRVRDAFAAYQQQNFVAAERLCRSVIATCTDDLDARHLLAVLLTRRGSLDEALVQYDKALLLKPDDVQLLCNRGVALDELQRHEEAVTSLAAALSIRPD